MCFFIQSCEPLGGGKKERKKCTSFLHEPCVLPASPSSPLSALLNWQKPASGRLACVGNPNHTTAFLPLSPVGTGEKSCPCFSLPSKLPWEPALTCAAGAGSVRHGLREPAHRLHAIPTASSSPPSRNSPPRVRPPEGLPGLGGWHVFLKQLQKVISHQLPRWVPFFFFLPVKTHMQTGHCCLLWLPCFEGAGVPVCSHPCRSCTLSLSYLSACSSFS